jgi:signal transduction histidine kinase
VGNAIKFSRRGGTVSVSASPEPGAVRFVVSDAGPGIPTGELPRIFDRYWQSRAGRAQPGGAGLGLYIAKSLVEAQGGRIGVSSAVGRGSTFHFTLPRASPPPPLRRAAALRRPEAPHVFRAAADVRG